MAASKSLHQRGTARAVTSIPGRRVSKTEKFIVAIWGKCTVTEHNQKSLSHERVPPTLGTTGLNNNTHQQLSKEGLGFHLLLMMTGLVCHNK
ncbi:hypothetical protein CEXT_692591 [Caerostris extrusa]|uniref:Uncharacterized protein n=1 Tax=Caerostris extrusa TaxID=172846 RepID=A0AAV4Y0R4_CAEEX|nr:hypothetical protein CEXT_692591 [Caerostris extrusa]